MDGADAPGREVLQSLPLSLFEAVAEPGAVIIDDVHWSDRSPGPDVHVGSIGGPRVLSRCNVAGRLLAAWDR